MELKEAAQTQAENIKAPVGPSELAHRDLREDEFWRDIPAFTDVDASTFHSHLFQMRNTITSVGKLMWAIEGLVSDGFFQEVSAGIQHAPMSVRISPYILSLINWDDPLNDPLRKQFLSLECEQQPDHPELHLDSLNELGDSPVPGLTHRYPDRVLFLVLDTCPVYCRFCTRSYAVGLDTEDVEKVSLRVNRARWDDALAYIKSRPEVEDVVAEQRFPGPTPGYFCGRAPQRVQ